MKYKQIICSILIAKLYKIAYKYDIGLVLKTILGNILRSGILLILFTNS